MFEISAAFNSLKTRLNKALCILIVIVGHSHSIYSQQLKIDHVITVVSNLDKAVDNVEAEGFTVKKGKQHSNGLINAHIKFTNGSSFEIMSINRNATDPIAKQYKALLNEGEGGVFWPYPE